VLSERKQRKRLVKAIRGQAAIEFGVTTKLRDEAGLPALTTYPAAAEDAAAMVGLYAYDNFGVPAEAAREIALLFFWEAAKDLHPELANAQEEEAISIYAKHRATVDQLVTDLFQGASGLDFGVPEKSAGPQIKMELSAARLILEQAAGSLEETWCRDSGLPSSDLPKAMILDEAITWAWSDAGAPPGLDQIHESLRAHLMDKHAPDPDRDPPSVDAVIESLPWEAVVEGLRSTARGLSS
jgi:hypothetical protein